MSIEPTAPAGTSSVGVLPYAPETHRRWGANRLLRRTIGQPVLYPGIYIWYVFFASLDVMLTWVILHMSGSEVNPIARWVIDHYDLAGMVIYKFLLVFFVVSVCEYVGRIQNKARLSHRLAEISVAITALPVVIAVSLLIIKLTDDSSVDWGMVGDPMPDVFIAPAGVNGYFPPVRPG
jgi:hypothetical protein